MEWVDDPPLLGAPPPQLLSDEPPELVEPLLSESSELPECPVPLALLVLLDSPLDDAFAVAVCWTKKKPATEAETAAAATVTPTVARRTAPSERRRSASGSIGWRADME